MNAAAKPPGPTNDSGHLDGAEQPDALYLTELLLTDDFVSATQTADAEKGAR